MSFKKNHTFEERVEEFERIKKKYPDRIPIICDIDPTNSNVLKLKKYKYIVPDDLKMAGFMFVLRKQTTLKPEDAIFIMVNNTMIPTSKLISDVYNNHKDEDGFLYFYVTKESAFG